MADLLVSLIASDITTKPTNSLLTAINGTVLPFACSIFDFSAISPFSIIECSDRSFSFPTRIILSCITALTPLPVIESKSLISEEHLLLPQDDTLVKYANTLGHKKTVQRTTRNFTSGKTSSTQFLLPKNTYRNKAGLLNSKEASKTFIETHSYEKINFTPKVIPQDQNSSSISNHGKTDMLPKI
jgi:hypothetical protein